MPIAQAKQRWKTNLLVFSSLLFCIGIFTCTWDRIFHFDLFHFRFKIQQGLFAISFLCTLIALGKEAASSIWEQRKNLFFLAILCLFFYYFVSSIRSFYPIKSAFYSIWLLFNLFTVWLNAILLKEFLSREKIIFTVVASLIFLSSILLIDHVAYSYGYTDGLIGHNQDSLLQWGASRPSAFSYEPSYLAVFFTLSLLFLIPQTLKRNPFFWIPLYILGFACLLILASRTGIISLIVGLGLFGVLGPKPKNRKRFFLISISALIFAIVPYVLLTPSNQLDKLKENLVSTIAKGEDGSGNARLRAHAMAWQLANESNFLGVGLGASYKYWLDVHLRSPNLPFTEGQRGSELIMSIWGQLLAEGGILALIFYMIAGFFLCRSTYKNWKKNKDPYYLSGFIGSFVFFVFVCFWIGNIARGDVWIWLAIWSLNPSSEERLGLNLNQD